MKDDFYKDIKHKRAQDEKSSKADAGNKQTDEQKRKTLSRSARHKSKETGDTAQPDKKVPPKKQQHKKNDFTDKLKGYFSAENAAKGKALFTGTLASYQKRIKNELKISKEKLGSIGAAKKAVKKTGDNNDGEKKRMLPWVFSVLILLPITALLAFLIFSNFWPSLNDEIQMADENNTEETVDSSSEADSETDAEINEALEAQKAEHEKRLAQNRNEDLSSKNIETNYSQEELLELEDAALAAIRSKEDGSDEAAAEEDSASEETAEDEAADSEAAEPESETAGEDTDSESDSETTQNANASHVVTPQDNLYRIAIQYYGDGSAENVQRIMEANGVTPDNLTVGQEIIIP